MFVKKVFSVNSHKKVLLNHLHNKLMNVCLTLCLCDYASISRKEVEPTVFRILCSARIKGSVQCNADNDYHCGSTREKAARFIKPLPSGFLTSFRCNLYGLPREQVLVGDSESGNPILGIALNNQLHVLSNTYLSQKLDTEPDDATVSHEWGDPEVAKLIFHITDFKSALKEYKSILVFFHASWCAHCRKLKRPYSAAALMLKEHNLPGQFAALDVTKNLDVADEQNIVGIPMLKYYRNGQFIANYIGPRTAEGIFNFMKQAPEEVEKVRRIEM